MAMQNLLPHILIVDDHKDIRDPLSEYFGRNGFRTSVAANGKEMDAVLARADVDIIILDVLMPGENGLEICQRLRRTTDLPVILLTAVIEDTDKIVGLELGADDYVTKPFNPRELLARTKSVLRRAHSLPRQYADMSSDMIRFADWQLNVAEQSLRRLTSDESFNLKTVEFRLLMAFLSNPRMVLSRDQLLDRVSNRSGDVFDRSIDNQVSRLRKKIDPDIKNPKIIKTVWGGGYMLIADVVKV